MNAYFVQLSLFNKWQKNYWDKQSYNPVVILGCLGLFFPLG